MKQKQKLQTKLWKLLVSCNLAKQSSLTGSNHGKYALALMIIILNFLFSAYILIIGVFAPWKLHWHMQMKLCNAYEDERDFCANRWDVDGTGVQVDRMCYQQSNLVFLFLVASGEK